MILTNMRPITYPIEHINVSFITNKLGVRLTSVGGILREPCDNLPSA